MNPIKLSSNNILDNLWVFDFFLAEIAEEKYTWKAGKKFKYNNNTFKFSETIFARERKNKERGYAFEILSKTLLGVGVCAAVYRISYTLSKDKDGIYSIKNKRRVVKNQEISFSQGEFNILRLVHHLHAKQPNRKGWMVMSEIEGDSVQNFLEEKKQFFRAEIFDLTLGILSAFKEQVVDLHLNHNDLSFNNILIKINPLGSKKRYDINIIDYGMAKYKPNVDATKSNHELKELIAKIKPLWDGMNGMPKCTSEMFQKENYSLLEYIITLESAVFAPNAISQGPMDIIVDYIKSLGPYFPELSNTLFQMMVEAVRASDTKNTELINKTVLDCKKLIMEHGINIHNFPLFIFDHNPKRQKLLNTIFNCYESISAKGVNLIPSHKEEGEKLCEISSLLKEKTFETFYANTDRDSIEECQDYCKKILKEHKKIINIHRGFFFEKTNKVINDKIGFFHKTETIVKIQSLEKAFSTLLKKFLDKVNVVVP